MIDLHCHLLPGIDDGPPTLDAALDLAKALVDDGITDVVVTPHVFPGRFENRSSNISLEFAAFQSELAATGVPLQLRWGGEVRLTPEVLDLLPTHELPFLGRADGYRTLLLEMPDGQVPVGALNFVRFLLAQGIKPLFAHPERNRGVMDNIERLQPLLDAGCHVQVTAGSLVGQFGARAQAVAAELLDRQWVHVIASDAHNLSGRRPRMLDAAGWITQHHGAALAHELTVLAPTRLSAENATVNGAKARSVRLVSATAGQTR